MGQEIAGKVRSGFFFPSYLTEGLRWAMIGIIWESKKIIWRKGRTRPGARSLTSLIISWILRPISIIIILRSVMWWEAFMVDWESGPSSCLYMLIMQSECRCTVKYLQITLLGDEDHRDICRLPHCIRSFSHLWRCCKLLSPQRTTE